MSNQRDIVNIASLLASRLCHDLVNPVGALNTGLDVLADESDPEMRDHAMSLILESTSKTIAILTFARMAFGSSGGWEGDIDMGEAKSNAASYFDHVKAELVWDLPEIALPKARARAVLNLLLIAERAAPRAGSKVTVRMDGDAVVVAAEGPKVKFSEEVKAGISGNVSDLQAKETPAYMAHLLATASGDAVSATAPSEQELVLRVAPAAA